LPCWLKGLFADIQILQNIPVTLTNDGDCHLGVQWTIGVKNKMVMFTQEGWIIQFIEPNVVHWAIQPQKPAPKKVDGYNCEVFVLLSKGCALIHVFKKSLKQTDSAKSFDIYHERHLFFFSTSFQLALVFLWDMEESIADCTKLNIGAGGFQRGKFSFKDCNSLRYPKSKKLDAQGGHLTSVDILRRFRWFNANDPCSHQTSFRYSSESGAGSSWDALCILGLNSRQSGSGIDETPLMTEDHSLPLIHFLDTQYPSVLALVSETSSNSCTSLGCSIA